MTVQQKPDLDTSRQAIGDLSRAVGLVSDTYAKRCEIDRDKDWSALKLSEETGELIAAHLKVTGRGRRNGEDSQMLEEARADEAADVFALLLLYAHEHDIDLVEALNRKWFRYLKTE
ncbi:phosphoribosyl-ATP pyrophosphohydrolase [Pelagibacterium lentulum]|uniref:Phosphoribosyl-ATP pyrophosphohydrolase n=1 Tax=Pelagibacterium lentulum TaxID=2029865 RepID=A0A916VWG8_9HYPH|nr:phosphoribosyl-ATP pyrophosphohydrolase [Pelagibacterium lentulum]GGA46926.1 hypothetical protein GCM10011499_15880 [Pelagibacterium lentulum]